MKLSKRKMSLALICNVWAVCVCHCVGCFSVDHDKRGELENFMGFDLRGRGMQDSKGFSTCSQTTYSFQKCDFLTAGCYHMSQRIFPWEGNIENTGDEFSLKSYLDDFIIARNNQCGIIDTNGTYEIWATANFYSIEDDKLFGCDVSNKDVVVRSWYVPVEEGTVTFYEVVGEMLEACWSSHIPNFLEGCRHKGSQKHDKSLQRKISARRYYARRDCCIWWRELIQRYERKYGVMPVIKRSSGIGEFEYDSADHSSLSIHCGLLWRVDEDTAADRSDEYWGRVRAASEEPRPSQHIELSRQFGASIPRLARQYYSIRAPITAEYEYCFSNDVVLRLYKEPEKITVRVIVPPENMEPVVIREVGK